MKNDEAKILAASLGGKMPELDLHGLYPDEAKDKVELFLYQCVQKKEGTARVIYGGGTGKLGEAVIAYLQNHPLVDKIVEQGGSVVIILYN